MCYHMIDIIAGNASGAYRNKCGTGERLGRPAAALGYPHFHFG